MRKDTSKLIDLDALFANAESKQLKETLKESAMAGNVPPEVAARIDLVNKFNFTTHEVDKMTSDEALEEYNKRSSLKESIDIDSILMEWSYRCDKGYPDFNNKHDMIKLQEILDEMGVASPFKRITEAPESSDSKVSAFPATLVAKLKKAGKLEKFKQYLNLFPGGDAIEKVSQGVARICTNKSDEDALVSLFKSTKKLDSILKIDLQTGIYNKLYNVRPSGTGPGEILISWYVEDAMFQGGNVSYDIDYKGQHWEVKSLISASGGNTPAAIDPAKYGVISKYKFATDFKAFFETIINPYYDNKLRDAIVSLSDNASVISKLTEISDLIEQLPVKTPQSGVAFSDSIDEMGAAMFNKFYTIIKQIHSKLPKSVQDAAKASRIAVKSSTTDAQYWIDPDDVNDITKNAGKDKEISIKVGTKINDENKDAKIWLARLMSNKFIKDPEGSFIDELRKIRDGFGAGKEGMIYLTVGKFHITNSMDDFFTSHITRGHFRFSLKDQKNYLAYEYAQKQ